jgi:hypothetical protein
MFEQAAGKIVAAEVLSRLSSCHSRVVMMDDQFVVPAGLQIFPTHFVENDGVPRLVPIVEGDVVFAGPTTQTNLLNEVEFRHGCVHDCSLC